MGKAITVKTTISQLIDIIKKEIDNSKQRMFNTFENERTITYWNIGRHINQHMLNYTDRADYGEYVFTRLAEEIDMGRSTLYKILQFYETYPEIVSARRQLTWTHYRILLTVRDEKKRKEYERRVLEEKLSTRELEDLVKEGKEEKNSKNGNIAEKRGIPFLYRLKKINDTLSLDLGFRIYKTHTMNGFNEDDIIEVKKENNVYRFYKKENINPGILFTYRGSIEEIVDGDTLWVNIDLGFEIRTKQKLRLRGINAADVTTGEGKKAQQYIINQLYECTYVIVKTYYRDKYNRYLADIYYIKEETDIDEIAEKGNFLNNELLTKGLAKKYKS
ncbi:MAG: thermonuclease family protein [Spirochaetales bacterium]|nr:thermonuclease family protein [Spirochaetales bacterium]